jgi:hypothetical protein
MKKYIAIGYCDSGEGYDEEFSLEFEAKEQPWVHYYSFLHDTVQEAKGVRIFEITQEIYKH